MKADGLVTTTAGELVRYVSHYSNVALGLPVVVTRKDRPALVLALSVKQGDGTTGMREGWHRL